MGACEKLVVIAEIPNWALGCIVNKAVGEITDGKKEPSQEHRSSDQSLRQKDSPVHAMNGLFLILKLLNLGRMTNTRFRRNFCIEKWSSGHQRNKQRRGMRMSLTMGGVGENREKSNYKCSYYSNYTT